MHTSRFFTAAAAAFFVCAALSASTLEDAHRLYFSGQPEAALAEYRALLKSKPSAEAALNAATVAQELGRHKEALGLLEMGRKAGVTTPDLLGQLAVARLNENDIPAAIKLFKEYEAAGGEPAPFLRLARAMAEMDAGNTDHARAVLEELAKDEPKFAIGQYYLGLAREKAGEDDGAITAYQDAVTSDSHFLEARPRLAAIFERLKRYDDAWRQFVRISYSDDNNALAEAGMARLASKITRKPNEIVPPRRLLKHTPVPAVAEAASLPVVRIGIGSSEWGQPTMKKTVFFRPSHSFSIVRVKTGQELARGEADEIWSIRLVEKGKSQIAQIYDSSGVVVSTYSDVARIRLSDRDTGTVIINTLAYAPGTAWGGMSDKEYRGELEVAVEKKAKRLVIVNVLSVEEYLYGVLAAEMPVAYPLEALKAQAVMARNIALYRSRELKLHKKDGYDLCDEQHCQVYSGVGVESEKVRAAVDATRGRVLLFQGHLCHTVFSSNCGGVTQEGTQAGWDNEPYWTSVSDARPGVTTPNSPWEWRRWVLRQTDVYCKGSQYVSNAEYRWARVVPAETIAAKLAKKAKLGRVKQIFILKRARSGRVQKVRVIGTRAEILLVKEHEIRHYLGLGSLRGNLFTVDTIVRNDRADRFVFYGTGWGHGVGFCQTGSAGRAEDGASYEEILSAYFPGTSLR